MQVLTSPLHVIIRKKCFQMYVWKDDFVFLFLHGVPHIWVTFTIYLCLLEYFSHKGKRMGPQLVPPLSCFFSGK